LQQISETILKEERFLLYIHTPFCGTCHLARTMLAQIETVHKKDVFYEMNAALFPEFMQKAEVESVPCLLIMDNHKIKEKVYAFKSVANIYSYLLQYKPELFQGK
jgi:thiol-disulfide isomerase/thioredoxin